MQSKEQSAKESDIWRDLWNRGSQRKRWHSAAEEMWLKHTSPAKPAVCVRYKKESILL